MHVPDVMTNNWLCDPVVVALHILAQLQIPLWPAVPKSLGRYGVWISGHYLPWSDAAGIGRNLKGLRMIVCSADVLI